VFPLRDNIPTDHFPFVTVALIAANVLVYFFLQSGLWELPQGGAGGDWTVARYAAVPCELTTECSNPAGYPAPLLTLFTAMFMHGSLLHLGGNMLFLWIFGNNVEDRMGPLPYLVFYLLAGLAAMAAQTLIDVGSAVPTLGASGAVAGVLGGYLLLFPRARVVTFVFIIFFFTILELPAMLFLIIWIAQQALFGYLDLTGSAGEGGVAYFAHIGGFVLGLVLVRVFARRTPPAPRDRLRAT
jgi:membrane associated rhomboid family serine protease